MIASLLNFTFHSISFFLLQLFSFARTISSLSSFSFSFWFSKSYNRFHFCSCSVFLISQMRHYITLYVAIDEYSGSLDHTCWSVRIHAHRYILTRESSSRIWRETAFDRSSIVLSICRLAKGLWYNRKSTFLLSNSFSADCNRFTKVSCIIETI